MLRRHPQLDNFAGFRQMGGFCLKLNLTTPVGLNIFGLPLTTLKELPQ
jgi:hypothetical protein